MKPGQLLLLAFPLSRRTLTKSVYCLLQNMEADLFSCLPSHASEALLLQAWQQLDQRHRFGIIPRVCRSWYDLSLPTFTSLELNNYNGESLWHLGVWMQRHGSTLQHFKVTLYYENYAQQVGVWLQRHGSALQHLKLDLLRLVIPDESSNSEDPPPDDPGGAMWRQLASGIQSCTALVSLHILRWRSRHAVPDLCRLLHLTQLQFTQANIREPSHQFLACLPSQLQALDLFESYLPKPSSRFVFGQHLSFLSSLTSLNLIGTGISEVHLAACPSLPPLQELNLNHTVSPHNQEALANLPCTCLNLEILSNEEFQEFITWCGGDQGMKCLGRLTGLEFELDELEGESANPPCLAAAATELRHLALAGDDAVVTDLSLLSGLTQVTSLCFKYTGPPDADVVMPLAALPNLQQLTVTGFSAVQADAVREAAVASGVVCCV